MTIFACCGGGDGGPASYQKATGSSPHMPNGEKLRSSVQGDPKTPRKWCIEDFDINETIGVGAYGRVRMVKVKGSTDQTPMALKILKKSEAVKMKQVQHVVDERNIHMKLRHPYIVNLLTTFQDPKRVFILLELVNGGELAQRIFKTVRLPDDEAKFYGAEVTLALTYLGTQNIAYRDLKPDNILLDADGHARLCDFGFSKTLKGKEQTSTLCGTAEYLAPEIIRMKGYGKEVDWWALGVLIFEMLQGTCPFAAETHQGVCEKILKGNIEFPGNNFNRSAVDAVKKLLVEKAKRPAGESVKKFAWYRGIDWKELGKRGYAAPFVPEISSAADTWNFERYPESTCESGETVDVDDEKLFADF